MFKLLQKSQNVNLPRHSYSKEKSSKIVSLSCLALQGMKHSLIRVFRFSGFKKEIAKHFFCSFVPFKLLHEFQS